MPWLPMYLTESDASALIDLLAQDREIAFLVSDGPRRWRAVNAMSFKGDERIALWHVPSGPLPLLPAKHGEAIHQVQDPWSGWTEERTGANPKTPFFGSHTGAVWLNLRTKGKDHESCCGLSSFEWLGNYYKIIGNAAAPSTDAWWKSFRRRVTKISRKVPRQGLSGSLPPEIFAFPSAYALLKAGGVADLNA